MRTLSTTATACCLLLATLLLGRPAEGTTGPSASPRSLTRLHARLLQQQLCRLAPLAHDSKDPAKRWVRLRNKTPLLLVLQNPTRTVAIDRTGQLFIADQNGLLRPVSAQQVQRLGDRLVKRLRSLTGRTVDLETTRQGEPFVAQRQPLSAG